MIIKCTSFDQMKKEVIDGNKSIIIFGAGAIGTVIVPEILKQFDLLKRVSFYVDNSCNMHGKIIYRDCQEIHIMSVDRLAHMQEKAVIVIAISRYAEVLAQLDNMPCTKNMLCYIMPMMCIHNFCSRSSEGAPVLEDNPLIPKKIHYMWLGKKQIPNKLQKCIDSWKKYCPDYEIIQWDESNYDISKNNYMKQAYEAGAFGFVPDYARLDILYQYGGIYMDTDVQAVTSFDQLLYQQAFCSVEKWQIINFGGCSGAVKGHKAILEFLNARKELSFINEDGSQNRNTCGFYDTKTALKNGYKINGKTQNTMGMNIYAYDYFHPYDYMSGKTLKTKNTYTIHWFNGGWLDEKMQKENEKTSAEYDRVYQECTINK